MNGEVLKPTTPAKSATGEGLRFPAHLTHKIAILIPRRMASKCESMKGTRLVIVAAHLDQLASAAGKVPLASPLVLKGCTWKGAAY